jgi:hypothetical protein
MITSSLLKILRGAALGVCFTLVLTALAPSVRAEDIPKFSAPEVNAFVRQFVDLTDAFAKAAADKDEAKAKDIMTKVTTLMATEGPALDPKITAEERPTFEKFIQTRSEKLMSAATP